MALTLPQFAGFEHRWADGNGLRLHVVEGGRPDGPPLVLLAGFPQTGWAWRKVMPQLAGTFRLIAVDLPGQGHSERPADGYDTQTVADSVHAAVTSLGISSYWLAGHDIGAWVAFSLALRHPDDLHGVALLDSGIPGITLPESIPTDPARAFKTWHFAFHVVPDLPEALLAGREREYVSWFLKAKTFSPSTFDDAEIDHYAASLAEEGGLHAALAYYRQSPESARRNHEALEQQRLIVPVLGISGSHGSIPDMAASIRPWAEKVIGIVVPDSGHFIPEEQPEAVAAALLQFADQTVSSSTR